MIHSIHLISSCYLYTPFSLAPFHCGPCKKRRGRTRESGNKGGGGTKEEGKRQERRSEEGAVD